MDMVEYGYNAVRQFPKSERHTLSAELRTRMLAILRLIVVANRSRDKTAALMQLDEELDALRVAMRLALKLGFLPLRKYEFWSKQVSEIGRMVGGWQRACLPATPAVQSRGRA